MGRLTLPPYSEVAKYDGKGNFAVKKYYQFPFSIVYRKKLKLILSMMKGERFYNVLDFGCGPAHIFEPELRKLATHVVSVDQDKQIDVRWNFDAIVCASVLEFVDLPVTVARLKLATKPKGMIVGASVMDTWITRLYFKLIKDTRARHSQKQIMDELNKRYFIVEYDTWFGIYFYFKGYPK